MKTLVIAAHADDEVLGCGAYMAKIAAEGNEVLTVIVSDGESSRFPTVDIDTELVMGLIANRKLQAIAASNILGTLEPKFLNFPDNRLDTIPKLDIFQALEKIIQEFSPERIITHHWSDLNIDHQILNEAAQVISRPQHDTSIKELLFFEVPSSTEWRVGGKSIYRPEIFIDVSSFVEQKFLALEAYGTEMRPFPPPQIY